MGIEWLPENTFNNDPHRLCERIDVSASSYGQQQVLARLLVVLDRLAARLGGDQTAAMRNAVEMLEDLTAIDEDEQNGRDAAAVAAEEWGDDYPRW